MSYSYNDEWSRNEPWDICPFNSSPTLNPYTDLSKDACSIEDMCSPLDEATICSLATDSLASFEESASASEMLSSSSSPSCEPASQPDWHSALLLDKPSIFDPLHVSNPDGASTRGSSVHIPSSHSLRATCGVATASGAQSQRHHVAGPQLPAAPWNPSAMLNAALQHQTIQQRPSTQQQQVPHLPHPNLLQHVPQQPTILPPTASLPGCIPLHPQSAPPCAAALLPQQPCTSEPLLSLLSSPMLLDDTDARVPQAAPHQPTPQPRPARRTAAPSSAPLLTAAASAAHPSLPPRRSAALSKLSAQPTTSASSDADPSLPPARAKTPQHPPPKRPSAVLKRPKLASIAKAAASARLPPAPAPAPAPTPAPPLLVIHKKPSSSSSCAPCPVPSAKGAAQKPPPSSACLPLGASVCRPLEACCPAVELGAGGTWSVHSGCTVGGQRQEEAPKGVVKLARKPLAKPAPRKGGASRKLAEVTCLNCGAQQTPQWRRGPDGPRTLCNACGVRFKKGLPLAYLANKQPAS